MENPEHKKDLIQSVEEAARLTHLMHLFQEKYETGINQENFFEIHDKVTAFAKKLFDKYSYDEVIKRQLFHVIAHSGIAHPNHSPYFDFEGDDSIEKFINQL